MILGAENQNKNLADAAAKRVDTSTRTKTANTLAAKVSSSKNSSAKDNSPTDTVESSSRSKLSQSSPDPVRGSFEGLAKQSSGHIQMDGDGYDNPGFQKARYKDRSEIMRSINKNNSNFNLNNTSSIKNNGIITNYSSRFNGNSIANRMNDITSTNDMFR